MAEMVYCWKLHGASFEHMRAHVVLAAHNLLSHVSCTHFLHGLTAAREVATACMVEVQILTTAVVHYCIRDTHAGASIGVSSGEGWGQRLGSLARTIRLLLAGA
jgi:hypothetical protein